MAGTVVDDGWAGSGQGKTKAAEAGEVVSGAVSWVSRADGAEEGLARVRGSSGWSEGGAGTGERQLDGCDQQLEQEQGPDGKTGEGFGRLFWPPRATIGFRWLWRMRMVQEWSSVAGGERRRAAQQSQTAMDRNNAKTGDPDQIWGCRALAVARRPCGSCRRSEGRLRDGGKLVRWSEEVGRGRRRLLQLR